MVMIKPNGKVQGASQAPQPQRIETEGDRKLTGLELEAAQVMLISVAQKGTGVLQGGSSSKKCCTGLYWQTNP